MPWAAQYAAFQKLAEICEVAALTPKERERYEESMKVYRDNIAIAQRAEADGEARGLAKGRAEGRAEGGREMQVEIALQMKKSGMPSSQIAQFTGLDISEVEKLSEKY